MGTTTSNLQTQGGLSTGKLVARRFAQIAVLIGGMAAALFLSSGDLRWGAAWVYLGVYAALIGGMSLLMLTSPDLKQLIAERAQIKEDTKGWDKVMTLLILVGGTLVLVAAGLDHRFGGSGVFHMVFPVIGVILYVAGYLLFLWAMLTNRFFSSLVRIQEDRGHAVASAGPYRVVRHPGYAGQLISTPGIALLLGSWWAMAAFGLLAIVIIARTALEDRTLHAELPGYAEYAQQTRYRLLPGIW